MLEGEQWCKKLLHWTYLFTLISSVKFQYWDMQNYYLEFLGVWYDIYILMQRYVHLQMAYKMHKSCWNFVFFLVLETSMGGFRHCWDTRLSSVDWTYLQFSCSWGPYIAICNRHFDRCSRLASRSIQVCKWISHAFNFKIIFFCRFKHC